MVAIARRISLSVLNELDRSKVTLDSLLAGAFTQQPGLARRDRALATELVYGVLRWRGRLDWIIGKLSDRPFRKINPRIRNVLRLGIYQILFLSRVPISAAVNDSVELAKEKSPHWVVPFVNAVLRSAGRQADKVALPAVQDDPVNALAIRESHPRWMIERWIHRMGIGQTQALCRANNRIPGITIRANSLRISRDDLLRALQPYVRKIKSARFAPQGLVLKGLTQPITAIPAFQQGWFQVQDEAAQLIAYLVDPRPGEMILDACAGLGGKTGHLVQLMKDSGRVVAVDRQPHKLSELAVSMARLGLHRVETCQLDLMQSLSDSFVGAFDRVLLDAPCSGLGVIRRNPDAKWRKTVADLDRLPVQQGVLLDVAASMVRPEGTLVYCVCSLEPEEGRAVIEGFLKRHGDFVIQDASDGLSEVIRGFVDDAGFFTTFPQKHDMDGFFAVRLKRD